MVEKSYFYEIGAFNEKYRNGCEDVDFCFKNLDAGRVNVCANRSVIEHHVSASRGQAHDDSPNFELLWSLWRQRLQTYSHIDSPRLFWRTSNLWDKLRKPKQSLHALTADCRYFPFP